MRYEISKLHTALATTMIYVTHDQVEAMTLADRIVVLDAGRIIQVGTPKELYNSPANTFVAQFIGSPKMNLVPCRVEGDQYLLEGHRSGGYSHENKAAVKIGIRPEHIGIVSAGEGQCDGKLEVIEYLGADTFLLLDCGEIGQISARVSGETELKLGETVGLHFDPSSSVFFDGDQQAIYS